jgi:hypothetical protein
MFLSMGLWSMFLHVFCRHGVRLAPVVLVSGRCLLSGGRSVPSRQCSFSYEDCTFHPMLVRCHFLGVLAGIWLAQVSRCLSRYVVGACNAVNKSVSVILVIGWCQSTSLRGQCLSSHHEVSNFRPWVWWVCSIPESGD